MSTTNEPAWLTEARRHLGVAEVPGPKHSPVIQSWLHKLRAWWNDDEPPWCGVFVAACMDTVGIPLPKYWMRAKAWAEWGSRLSAPIPGCVVVFERQGGGHVGFVVGRTANGHLMVLGGDPEYTLHFYETDALSEAQRNFAETQYKLFRQWYANWSAA